MRSYFFILFLFLNGCSVGNEYYIVNHSDQPIQIEINYIDAEAWAKGLPYFSYGSDQINPSSASHDQLSGKISFEQIDLRTVKLTQPAHTILFVGFGTNGRQIIKQIKWSKGSQQTIISAEQMKSEFKIYDSLMGNVRMVMEME